jgi:hypothetical protein
MMRRACAEGMKPRDPEVGSGKTRGHYPMVVLSHSSGGEARVLPHPLRLVPERLKRVTQY